MLKVENPLEIDNKVQCYKKKSIVIYNFMKLRIIIWVKVHTYAIYQSLNMLCFKIEYIIKSKLNINSSNKEKKDENNCTFGTFII